MKTSTLYAPTSIRPSSAIWPPTTSVAVKPTTIAMRMIGTKAELTRIALRFASRYALDAAETRVVSADSAVKLLIVAMPERLFASVAFTSATFSRTVA